MHNDELIEHEKSEQEGFTKVAYEEYAELWQRIVASLIDVLIIFTLMYVGFIFSTGSLFPYLGTMEEGEVIEVLFIYLVFFLIILILYIDLLEYRTSKGTFGKRFMKIKTVDLEGKQVQLRRGQFRELCKLLTCLTLLIGFFIAAFTKEKRTLHDRLSGTKVVKVESSTQTEAGTKHKLTKL